MLSFAVNLVIQFKTKARLLNFSLSYIYLFVCVGVYIYVQMPQCMYGNQKTTLRVQFFPFTMWKVVRFDGKCLYPLSNLMPKDKAFINMCS